MTKTIWTAACAALMGIATAAGSAQTTPAPQSNTSTADRKITVTGCLKEAPESSATTASSAIPGTTGTTGTAGVPPATGTTGAAADTAATAQKFLLTNASAASADTAAAASTTGEPAPATTASGGQTYQLIANSTALAPHVGKKLALTGTLEDQPSAAGTTESATGSASKTATLRVESGKVLAASCSQ
jgi:hypothetical protein